MAEKFFGKAMKRVEDPRFITGSGNYTDDMVLPGMVHVAMVRSPYAHARIKKIDPSKALAMPGVLAVITGQEMIEAGIKSIPTGWLHPGIKTPPHYAITPDKARHVGDIVAAVVAETRQLAEDAAQMVEVEYEPLPAVALGSDALKPGAPAVHDDIPDNICFTWSIGDKAATDAAFEKAYKTVRLNLRNNRLVPNAMEPRSSLAQYHHASGEFTLYTTSQNPHIHRLIIAAFVMGIPEHKLRVIAPDVGGGFGSKIYQYPEEIIVLYASKKLNRPVKWTARRSESFAMDSHGRDHETVAEMAVDKDGKILAVRVETIANMGAYLTTFAPAVPTYLYGCLLAGPYTTPHIYCHVTAPFTHTTPVDAYRGAGRPEATYLLERLVDVAAQELGMDPVELRRRNLIPPEAFPYQTPVALVYDSGNYEAALNRALEMVDYAALRKQQEEWRKQGRYMGIGVVTYIEACGLAPSALVGSLGAQAGQWESALVRVMPTGKVEVFTGTHSHGQGHETAFAQVVADELQIPVEDVVLVHGDTGRMPYGWGSYGSRSAPTGLSAIVLAARKIVDKAKRIAAHLLEAAPEDIVHEDGKFMVRGVPEKAKTFFDIALQAHLAHNYPADLEPGLEATHFYDPKNFVYPFGTHIAVVEVDPDTGKVKLLRYLSVDDCGPVINPLIAEGQVHGGIAQGLGQALLEEAVYDKEGQFLSANLLEYALPRADDMVQIEHDHTVTPCPHNPLGVKGIGEAGTIASTAAVANAVMDALRPFGIKHLDMPYTPEKVWRAIHGSRLAQAAD
ncbi:Carbon monoxide dehydrogenase large chain [Meiothermus luteus]|jgi:carbon-monoxide dehydrogenase large subunit|uniref:Carbon monoxide dehydrogenase large chain n=1 Tax=Meiothermus luteus TaxID=2026184 RepID=A0A399EIJ3_9DEIN|nr:molybdopterin cofactor-binding domain-containing protein [Meiothermus luteus]RIH82152.1 Carbon monoxide dehydrogenase large chain [Meiothermus luteus]RMH53411.1 MAG: xanthine dehydrogenase family protein molybdopterin-binding subunit [Deinococcota bacterium]